MRTLRDLLTTWENWSARDVLRRAIETTPGSAHRVERELDLVTMPRVSPLDALRDSAELLRLLSAWQWQAVYAARAEDGASWVEIGQAIGVTPEQARAEYVQTLDWMQDTGLAETTPYREVL